MNWFDFFEIFLLGCLVALPIGYGLGRRKTGVAWYQRFLPPRYLKNQGNRFRQSKNSE